jgi:hypothetical protein
MTRVARCWRNSHRKGLVQHHIYDRQLAEADAMITQLIHDNSAQSAKPRNADAARRLCAERGKLAPTGSAASVTSAAPIPLQKFASKDSR